MKLQGRLLAPGLLVCSLFSGLWPGATAVAQPADALGCSDPGSSLLWQVTGPQLDDQGMTLHLFGSLHVGKREFYPLHPRIEEPFRQAGNLVFEVDPQAAADPQTALRLQLRGMLPADQTLRDVLSAEAFANLENALARLGIPLQGFMDLKPWMITLLLANFQANALGYSAEQGLESYFLGQKAAATRVHELESLEQQLALLEGLDPNVFLGYSLDELDAPADEMDVMLQAWRCADKAALSNSLFAAVEVDSASSPEQQAALDDLFEQLFTRRNLRMAEGIENFIRNEEGGRWFVVVGAAHLLGAGSVVDLLQQRGYRVEAVRLD